MRVSGGYYRKTWLGGVLVIVFSLLSSMAVQAVETSFPFKPGERLTYVLKWQAIPAGEAVLEVQPMTEVGGDLAYHFVMTTKTNSFVDFFYKVRDRIDAYSDSAMQHSVLYKKKQREGRHQRDVVVSFDWQEKVAQYVNKGKKRKPISLLPGSFDPLSAFYYIRLVDMKPDARIFQPVTDGKKNVMAEVHVVRRETIKVSGQSYDTFLIEPELKDVGGVFKKSKNAKLQIWVTADQRHIPVRVKSKVVVGSFIGDLVSSVE